MDGGGITNPMMNADLVVNTQRHNRDLFSGSAEVVGLPNISTHVGSVIHAFETMAMKQNTSTDAATSSSKSNTPQPSTLEQLVAVATASHPERRNEKKFFKNTKSTRPPNSSTTMEAGQGREAAAVSGDRQVYEATSLSHDYRRNFQEDHHHHQNHQNDDDNLLLRGTMVSRSFIKSVRKPRRTAPESPAANNSTLTSAYAKETGIRKTIPSIKSNQFKHNANTYYKPHFGSRAVL